MQACVCLSICHSVNRLHEFTKSTDRHGRSFGAPTLQCSFRTAVPAQMPKAVYSGQTPAALRTQTQAHSRHIGLNFSCLQLIQRQLATPAVSKILCVITKHDTVKDASFHLRFENWLKILFLSPSHFTSPWCRRSFVCTNSHSAV